MNMAIVFYSYHQYDTFSVIFKLKKMGMSLKRNQVFSRTAYSALFLQLLDGEKLDREIQKLLAIKTYDEVYMKKSTVMAITQASDESVSRGVSKEILLCSKNLENSSNKSASFMEEYIHFCQENNVLIQESVGCMIKISNIEKHEYSNFSHLFMIDHDIQENTHIRKRAYLCGWHTGSYDTMTRNLSAHAGICKQNQIALGTFAYEEYLIAEIAQKDA